MSTGNAKLGVFLLFDVKSTVSQIADNQRVFPSLHSEYSPPIRRGAYTEAIDVRSYAN